jgi:hypothetical protein
VFNIAAETADQIVDWSHVRAGRSRKLAGARGYVHVDPHRSRYTGLQQTGTFAREEQAVNFSSAKRHDNCNSMATSAVTRGRQAEHAQSLSAGERGADACFHDGHLQ